MFSTHILLIKNSRTIWYSVTTIRVFEYYLEITNGPNMNSTFQSQLFKYQIIQIIWSNSDFNTSQYDLSQGELGGLLPIYNVGQKEWVL